MIVPVSIAGAGGLIRLLFIEIRRERRRDQLKFREDLITLFLKNGVASHGDELTRLLACGIRPRRAVRLAQKRARRASTPPPRKLSRGRTAAT